MSLDLLGSAWLQDHYKLYSYQLTHFSVTGTRFKKETDETGLVTETYPPHYAPGDGPLDHLAFALKYDDISLDFLKAVFSFISPEEVTAYIEQKPRGIYQRKIGFLYEFLTGKELPVADQSRGNYINLLDEDHYVTGKLVKNQRWLINDNLPGNQAFCPIVRKTAALQNLMQEDFQKMVEDVTKSFPPDIFHRAVHYLYTKETRSSYQIEQEKPSPERVNRFIRLLEKAGSLPVDELLGEEHLTRLQNEIVDPRYAAKGFRDFQNYIGQTTFDYKQIIHYVCPPPEYVHALMNGLANAALKTLDAHAIVRAAITAFGFVFIHPFEDGNGRLHRFLIHDLLIQGGVVPKGMIIPVSAHMLQHMKDYDAALENYSVPLIDRVRYELNEEQLLKVKNADAVEGYFRYPDLTAQCIYLGKVIRDTIREDIYQEMEFLVNYDEAKVAIQNVVDMPDREIDLFIRFLHQNRGQFPSRRRKQFEELTDNEIERMERAFREIFRMTNDSNPPEADTCE